jgi:hypothetical protein
MRFVHALDAIFELTAVVWKLLSHLIDTAWHVATERGSDGDNLADFELVEAIDSSIGPGPCVGQAEPSFKSVARRYARPCRRIIQTPVASHGGPEEGPAAARVVKRGWYRLSVAPPYGFGEVRVAMLALLIFTALSG